MTFLVPAEAYDRFMGRFSTPLAPLFADAADVRAGHVVLDVGCGPGALTQELVRRVGAASVAAIDPSPPFVAALRERLPGVDVRTGTAEALPFADDTFERSLAQLVVHFMADPVAGLAEMARVTRPGGLVAATVWDHSGSDGPLSLFWRAVRDVDQPSPGEAALAGVRPGELASLCEEAGLTRIQPSRLTVRVRSETFDDWWEPYLLGVGPVGAHIATLEPPQIETLRARCAELLGPAPFEVAASAWCVRATAA
ncbi:MAG: Methyltransferase type 11 [Actinotalea sp.]|jgi:SAM-dependent methyltransferase|nr:Methyltransferase type 11 [Actinotalea sp.]